MFYTLNNISHYFNDCLNNLKGNKYLLLSEGKKSNVIKLNFSVKNFCTQNSQCLLCPSGTVVKQDLHWWR